MFCEDNSFMAPLKEGETMEDRGFGLAEAKPEGQAMSFDPLHFGSDASVSNTRWIEVCYDPEEDVSHLPIDQIREAMQTAILCNNLSNDDVYLMIKAIANEFIEEEGF